MAGALVPPKAIAGCVIGAEPFFAWAGQEIRLLLGEPALDLVESQGAPPSLGEAAAQQKHAQTEHCQEEGAGLWHGC